MKHILTSAGLLALGAVSLQAVNTGDMSRVQAGKPWSVSASLRGFYDDNYTTSPERDSLGRTPQESFGVEVRPAVSLNLPMDQTFIGVG